MKLLNVNNKNLNYEFRLLESVQIIEIYKESKFTYVINLKFKKPICNCPGSVFKGKCWHLGMVKLVNQQSSINEPWTEWTEDAGRMKYGKKSTSNELS